MILISYIDDAQTSLKALVFSFILKYQPSSCVFETDAALTLALWIPPFEYQPKDKQQQTPTQVLRNAVSIFAVSICCFHFWISAERQAAGADPHSSVLRNAVFMTHRCFRAEKVAISPQCLRTLSRAGSFQSYTALAPSLFRSGTKRWVIDCNIDMFEYPFVPGSKWPHQKDHRPGYSELCSWNCWNQRFHHIYHLSGRWR